MRISDWSSDVCSSDLRAKPQSSEQYNESQGDAQQYDAFSQQNISRAGCLYQLVLHLPSCSLAIAAASALASKQRRIDRSEERRVGKECVSTCRSRWLPTT